MTEQQPYTVVRAFPGFDVRRYPDRVLVQVQVDGDFTRAASRGFRPIQDYLDGNNRSAATIPMAPPVLQEQTGESGHLISVALPGESDLDRVPVPLDETLRILVVPAHEAAVLRFGGGWSTKRFTDRGRALLGSLTAADLLPDGPVYFARFDPPFRPGLLGRNEALVRVTSA
ncbi:SOUL family heme-binding protein [Cryobacterium adonitolivorans]|nr:heme-binding protein [Cryobacterium adonitolivorans]